MKFFEICNKSRQQMNIFSRKAEVGIFG